MDAEIPFWVTVFTLTFGVVGGAFTTLLFHNAGYWVPGAIVGALFGAGVILRNVRP